MFEIVEVFDYLDVSVLVQLLKRFEVDSPILDRFPDLALCRSILLHHHISIFKYFLVRVIQHAQIKHSARLPKRRISPILKHRQAVRRLPRPKLR